MMFCPLEKVELKIDTCPASKCMYKGVGGSCNYERLTSDDVDVHVIADVRQMKAYMVKAHAATSKQMVTLGVTIMQYCEFIKTSFPDRGQTVNEHEDTHIARVLATSFQLSSKQQSLFWEEKRFTEWTKRANLTVTLKDIRQALLSASISQ